MLKENRKWVKGEIEWMENNLRRWFCTGCHQQFKEEELQSLEEDLLCEKCLIEVKKRKSIWESERKEINFIDYWKLKERSEVRK
jgi:transposase-like protein